MVSESIQPIKMFLENRPMMKMATNDDTLSGMTGEFNAENCIRLRV